MEAGMFQLGLKRIGEKQKGSVDGLALIMLVRGHLCVEVGDLSVEMAPDDVLLLNSGDTYTVEGGAETLVLCLCVSGVFIHQQVAEMVRYRYRCNSSAEGTPNSLLNTKYFQLKKSLVQVLLAYCRNEENVTFDVRYALLSLLYEIYTGFRVEVNGQGGADRSIQNALSYIYRNFRGVVTLDDLAMAEGVSPQYFSKKFKQKVGVGFLEFLNGVRLKSAAYDLAHTNETMLRIAVNNGFANAKAFDAVFRKKYGVSPKAYRMEHAGKGPGDEGGIQSMDIDRDEDLNETLRYIVTHDLQNGGGFRNIERTVVPLSQDEERAFVLPKKIFKVGRIAELLHFKTRAQIEMAQRELCGDYICFKGVFDDAMADFGEGSFYRDFEYEHLLLYLYRIGLVPFVRLDISNAPWPNGQRMLIPEIMGAIGDFVDVMRRTLPRHFWKRSLFVVEYSNPSDEACFMECYKAIHRLLKEYSPEIRVGFHSTDTSDPAQREMFEERLILSKNEQCEPDFATIGIDPACEHDFSVFNELSCLRLKNYGMSQIEKAWHIVDDCGSSMRELYAMEWNTLSGLSPLESASFFRTALMANELVQYGDRVGATAYWVNALSKEMLSGCNESRSIGLFLFNTIKRPPYSLLRLLRKMCDRLLYQSERIVATTDGEGRYCVLLMNPRYFNPAYSFDETYEEMESVHLEVVLTGFEPGRYAFKVFTFDKEHCIALGEFAKASAPSLNDEDTTEFLERATMPEYSYYTATVDGSYTLSQKLSYNAIALYEIWRV
ncbi:helix-turn-helix domain-containing protein [Synergistaceae bacterium OttesenSCG-928-I11]|nr:helix-turn-helix domain-containing protein [Synergistaceae bacterium OttesenSCG-928-I11]